MFVKLMNELARSRARPYKPALPSFRETIILNNFCVSRNEGEKLFWRFGQDRENFKTFFTILRKSPKQFFFFAFCEINVPLSSKLRDGTIYHVMNCKMSSMELCNGTFCYDNTAD